MSASGPSAREREREREWYIPGDLYIPKPFVHVEAGGLKQIHRIQQLRQIPTQILQTTNPTTLNSLNQSLESWGTLDPQLPCTKPFPTNTLKTLHYRPRNPCLTVRAGVLQPI